MTNRYNMFEDFKLFIYGLILPILAFFEPINNLIVAVAILYLINIAAGVIEDVKNNNTLPNFGKFIFSILELLAYMLFLLTTFGIATLLDDMEGGKGFAKILTYVAIYFYAQNSIKNMLKIAPENQFLQFISFVVNVRFINEKAPILKEFFKWKSTNKDER